MKRVLHTILLLFALNGFSLEASELTLQELRMQERHFALADFKKIYEERQSINKQLSQRVKYNRTKIVQHNTLFMQGNQQIGIQKAQSGSMNNAGAFNGAGMSNASAGNSAIVPSTGNNAQDNGMSETAGHRPQNNLWGKRP